MATPNAHTGYVPVGPYSMPAVIQHGSFASNRAASILGQFGPIGFNVRILNVWWSPVAADNAATSSDSYRRLSLYNGGTAGTVTATASRIASLNLTASVASRGRSEWTVDATVTVASSDVCYVSQNTVGADSVTNTQLEAGQIGFSYEII